jgi:hypothetical protein
MLMNQVTQAFQTVGIKDGVGHGLRDVRSRFHGRHTPCIEGVDGIAYGLVITMQIAGDGVGVLPIGIGEQHLTTAQRKRKRVRGTQSGFERCAFLAGHLSYIDWWAHV